MPETFPSHEVRALYDRMESSRQLVNELAWDQAKEEAMEVAATITRHTHRRVVVTNGQGK